MKLKVLKYEGNTEVVEDSFGQNNLYANGAKRIVFAYYLFPTMLSDEKRRGFQFVEQTAHTISSPDPFGGAYVNHTRWESTKFIDFSSLEEKVNNS